MQNRVPSAFASVISSTLLLFLFTVQPVNATKLAEVRVVDKDYLEVYFKDGDVFFVDNGKGPSAFLNLAHDTTNEILTYYGTGLNTATAVTTASWKLASADDAAYGTAGLAPVNCFRKSKLNGMYEGSWSGSDFVYSHTMEHHIYLKLPSSLVQGKTYTLQIAAGTNTDSTSATFTYDIYSSRSEAVHVNLSGYSAAPNVKAADLYAWLGDGGARDYSGFVGNKVYIVNTSTGTPQQTGTVSLWKTSAAEAQGYNMTGSNVWKVDFTGFTTPGTYRLAVDGVGCSQDFTIADTIYHDPFMVAVRGYFYMRIGQDSAGIRPIPRRPLYIPGKDPANTVVYITTMQPTDPAWTTFTGGDVWDNPDAWAPYKNGKTNANAYGGHADAADWDRNMNHISNIYDMLFPYILTGGALSDDNLGIAESRNGIPDIIDEARNEVDFWLRLRDGQAYSYGLTNPDGNNVLYQAGTNAIAAWAAAAGSAMLAEAFRIAGNTALSNAYRDSAVNAYNFAGTLADQMLDFKQNVGESTVRGRDLKMTAAAYLYNLTGTTAYEDEVNAESKAASSATAAIIDPSNFNQIWATAGYLKTNRTVHYQTLYSNMVSSVVSDAKNSETNYSGSRPSRRCTDNNTEYFHTETHVHRTILAHAVAATQADKDLFLNALICEADWNLGRNPANLIQMTTASTPLSSKRSVDAMYISGGNDGTPGQHPGMTPYFNTDDWGGNMIMGNPSWMCAFSYPANNTWPKGEVYFNTRWVYAHSEFTPQQTMRGKIALYGYLYGIRNGNNPVRQNPGVIDNLRNSAQLFRIERLANGNFALTFTGATEAGKRLQLYNCTGRLIKSIMLAGNRASVRLETATMDKGIYFLKVEAEGRKVCKMIAVF
ncbi:MAG TPA: cellulase N-terminal Ig-like domain-containing protein [Chitinivibrionales bacterium]|nr:cellulase N-terminal Ig-like domain-containing protein [Chitinivibrionales bacterium]